MRSVITILFFSITFSVAAQKVSPLWKDFVSATSTGKTPVLPDFSYAGYHFSEKHIPEVGKRKQFKVTDYGALPNDTISDEEGIQAAIDAAEAEKDGGVVYFPAGKYLLVGDTTKKKQIRITKSNIVLKGAGSGAGGTEIFQQNMWVNNRLILFKPVEIRQEKLATVTGSATRETFWIEVADARLLKEGQDVVLSHKSETYTRKYFAPLELKPVWTRLFGDNGGMNINEIHTIEKIDGKRVKFKNPLHLDVVQVEGKPWELLGFQSMQECGVEDILFSSNWKIYPEAFIHHKNAIHDNAYVAIGMEYAKNSWVRNCVFQDWNDALFFRAGYAVTVENVILKGKKGHTSIHARSGYGVLIKNCQFNGAQHHGAGTGYGAAGTVIMGSTLASDQNIDIHSGQPYATLFDDIKGGIFSDLGGPEPGHPHHGKHLVLWNFIHQASKEHHYNFWDLAKRRNYTIALPILAGFQSDKKVSFENTGINESQGEKVLPGSLFDAQLTLRLTGVDVTNPSPTIKQSMKPAVKKGGFKMEGYILWCPTVIKVGDTYHMFASRWPEQYGLGGWTKYSEIVRATSADLYGPYTFQEVVIQKREGYWDNDRAHNPKIVKAGDTFVLYYISSANETGYAYSRSITGPWTRVENLAMPFSNPAPLVRKDGSIYVFGRKSVNDIRIAQAYTAAAFDSTYKLLNRGNNLLPAQFQLEDPTIWWASGQYNIILNDFRADATGIGKAGAQYYSEDGLSYKLVSTDPVFTKTVDYDDGSSFTFRRRERPFVYVDEKGRVTAFFTACLVENGASERSWIEVNPVDNYVPPAFSNKKKF